MVIKAGLHRRAHFAHHKGECVSDYERDPDTNPESPQHLAAKDWLRGMLPTHYVEYRDARLEFEVPIIEVKRVVDLLAVFPTGHKVAHEIQLSPITPEVLQQRTDDYEQAGIDVVWWLGKSAKTEANKTGVCKRLDLFSLSIMSKSTRLSMINLTDGIQCSYIAENAYAFAIFSSTKFSYMDISVLSRYLVKNENELSIIKNSKTFPETRLMRERKSRISGIWKDVFIPSFEGMERHREVLKNWLALLPNMPDVDEFGRPWELHKRSGRTPIQQRYFIIIKNRMVDDR